MGNEGGGKITNENGIDDDELNIEQENCEYDISLLERKIITQPSEPTIAALCDKIDRGQLEVRPEFQREYVWEKKPIIKSRLIESVILGIPIPIIYTAEEGQKADSVIDGQQRLLTFHDFKNNEFKLRGLSILKELNGYKFEELSNVNDENIKRLTGKIGDLQDKFCDSPIKIVKVLKESHPDIKFDLFERLNRGSVKLNSQEVRNCIYLGNFNDLLKELRNNEDFLRLQGLKKAHVRMLDVERILRFFAFCDLSERNYKAPLKVFLNRYMDSKRNVSEDEIKNKTETFKKCVELCQTVFGNIAYKRFFPGDEENVDGHVDDSLNQGIFDIQMYGFMEYDKRDIIPRAQDIKEAFLDLVTLDQKFINTIEIGTYSTNQVKIRTEIWINKLREIIGYSNQDKRLFTYEDKKRLFDKDRICSICKNSITYIEDAHVDHIERYSDGGKTEMKNARLTHRYCNLQRR